MRSLSVSVAAETQARWGEISVANHVTRELRRQGAPIADGLLPFAVEQGRVVIELDAFGDLLVTWEGE